ncbi:hypothetical protein GGS23DRAFT_308337 [Durotheca rogersii]|uniref:uncharacterized protein n=1 Tax=Durotheca rogersii TaxID=419775 RepID=UPI00221E76ED|nr:uncharacterized protein GGS23DRAFT_308337 [Durotheca rogersii]KAI5859648.1 hypothetical protein GGS23DRAFT_308337 [Durotheca rogersii]
MGHSRISVLSLSPPSSLVPRLGRSAGSVVTTQPSEICSTLKPSLNLRLRPSDGNKLPSLAFATLVFPLALGSGDAIGEGGGGEVRSNGLAERERRKRETAAGGGKPTRPANNKPREAAGNSHQTCQTPPAQVHSSRQVSGCQIVKEWVLGCRLARDLQPYAPPHITRCPISSQPGLSKSEANASLAAAASACCCCVSDDTNLMFISRGGRTCVSSVDCRGVPAIKLDFSCCLYLPPATYLPIYLPTYLPTCLPTYLPYLSNLPSIPAPTPIPACA